MPETLIFFTLLHQNNVTLAIKEIDLLIKESNLAWSKRIPEFIKQALDNIRGTIRYYKI